MKERPIIFDAKSVRAILAGGKTQTRRVVKHGGDSFWTHPGWRPTVRNGHITEWSTEELVVDKKLTPKPHRCPYGLPGDRLWVR